MSTFLYTQIYYFLRLTLLIFCVSGCTSLVGKGDKLYESGLYSDALTYYEKALRKNPNNVDAKIGLDKARYKIIDRGLIDVRMLRLSADMPTAVATLDGLLRNEKLWNVQLLGAVTSTKSIEIGFARRWLLKEAEVMANQPFPDLYKWFAYRFAAIIDSADIHANIKKHENKVSSKAKQQCDQLKTHVVLQNFFLKDFTQIYCDFWNHNITLNIDNIDQSRFRGLQIDNAIRLSRAHHSFMVNKVDQRLKQMKVNFQQSIWYTPNGKSLLNVKAKGMTHYAHDISTVSRVAGYQEEETTTSKDSQGKEVIKTKRVDRQYKYFIDLHSEEFIIDLSLQSNIEGKAIHRTIKEVEENFSESHKESFSQADLEPSAPDLLDINHILEKYLKNLTEGFFIELTKQWTIKYCENMESNKNNIRQGENILRCAAVDAKNPQVNRWFENNFGINYGQMIELTSRRGASN